MIEDDLNKALHLLGEFLADGSSAPVWLVVGGGSALLAQRLSNRPTKDVDVMALREREGNVISAYPLPEPVKQAAATETEESLRWIFQHLLGTTTHPKLHPLLQELGHDDLIPAFT